MAHSCTPGSWQALQGATQRVQRDCGRGELFTLVADAHLARFMSCAAPSASWCSDVSLIWPSCNQMLMHWQKTGHAVSLHHAAAFIAAAAAAAAAARSHAGIPSFTKEARTGPLSMAAQDDAHIFCLPSQLTAEIRGALELVQKTMAAFGFTQLEVCFRPTPLHATEACMQSRMEAQLAGLRG